MLKSLHPIKVKDRLSGLLDKERMARIRIRKGLVYKGKRYVSARKGSSHPLTDEG